MGIAERLDARAQAIRSVFEQTRQRHAFRAHVQKPETNRSTNTSEIGWHTSVGPQALRAIFEPLLEPAGQNERSRIASKADEELLVSQCASSPIPDAPRRQAAVLKGRHAAIINELIRAHRLL